MHFQYTNIGTLLWHNRRVPNTVYKVNTDLTTVKYVQNIG